MRLFAGLVVLAAFLVVAFLFVAAILLREGVLWFAAFGSAIIFAIIIVSKKHKDELW